LTDINSILVTNAFGLVERIELILYS
jgi:hypothetical protein